jgi:hypothetical protein
MFALIRIDIGEPTGLYQSFDDIQRYFGSSMDFSHRGIRVFNQQVPDRVKCRIHDFLASSAIQTVT